MARLLTQEELDALRGNEPYVAAPTERYRVSVEAGSTESWRFRGWMQRRWFDSPAWWHCDEPCERCPG